jgi:4-amino-4-deoxy-L-arabinose transferase-like glycosyltransferase
MNNGFFAMRLNQHWDWHPFYFWTQLQPLLIWALAALFKITSSTLTAIRIIPALISVLILPFAYGSVRNFFPKSTAILYLTAVSTGFGFLYFGRICHQGLLLLLWEFMGFYVLGKFLKSPPDFRRSLWLGTLGLIVGTGFYTYLSWPVVGLMILIPAFVGILRFPSLNERNFQLGLLGGTLVLSP